MILLIACAHPQLPVDVPPLLGAEVTYFDLEGTDRIELVESCVERCPRDDFGNVVTSLTLWSVDWSWSRRPYEPCEVDGVSLGVDVDVTFPRWEAREEADVALVDEWRTYVVALERHEQGHVDLVHDLARGTAEALANEPCDRVESAMRDIVEENRVRQHDYDVETEHGRTQGRTSGRSGGGGSDRGGEGRQVRPDGGEAA